MPGIAPQGLHLLLTYRCDSECDHCFVWAGPRAKGTMTVAQIDEVLDQGTEVPSVKSIYFEGGEPFLYYPVMLEGVRMARSRGFEVGIVTNAYWATTEEDARRWLEPLARFGISDLSVSADELHGAGPDSPHARNAAAAAEGLGVPASILSVRSAESYAGCETADDGSSEILFRGRAAANIASKLARRDRGLFTSCPEEPPNLGRVHIDHQGNVLFCQGIAIGNFGAERLSSLFARFSPEEHPIVGPLTRGGPMALSQECGVETDAGYVDACHMCYDVRCRLRAAGRFLDSLVPDQSYGV